jgi:hypothetical protein
MDNTLASQHITVERKQFFFDLKENPRGRFLRVTEDVNGRRDTIIIPAPGLKEFMNALASIIEADELAGSPEIPCLVPADKPDAMTA